MAVKSILRRLFNQSQWDKLSAAKHRLQKSQVDFIEVIARRLSPVNQLELKSRLQFVGRMDYEPAEVLLYLDTAIEYETRLHSCKKEPEMVRWIESSFGKGTVFFDVGANIGAYSLLAAKLHGRDISVYAFEPAFPNFSQLCKNIGLNECQDNITPLQIGLSNTTYLATFNYAHLNAGSALRALGEPVDQSGEVFVPLLRLPVMSYRLDELINCFDLPMPTHIKIDVDGIELEILKGASSILKNDTVKELMVEVEEGMDSTLCVIQFLSEKGFFLKEKYNYVLSGGVGKYGQVYNYLFARF